MATFQTSLHQLMAFEQSQSSVQYPQPSAAGGEADGPRTFAFVPVSTLAFQHMIQHPAPPSPTASQTSHPDAPAQDTGSAAATEGGAGANHYPSSSGVPRLPPILQVEKQQVTTSATQLASANRRRNEANFACPVPGCGSTFTRRFNLRGHLRSHTEERPFVCEWPGCNKGFARQHDCKRHQALHANKPQSNVCQGCKKTFSRLDALNRHLRSEGAADCRQKHAMKGTNTDQSSQSSSSQTPMQPQTTPETPLPEPVIPQGSPQEGP
ncbi:hypothetical protein BDP27DRAFT_1315003 [Rhodocollybia butyracea]|uniref:C2H2-type domain-containing protein n=1 Tax=Rhodocollybia butyracea TaxID=206335 RepID=A0A9P5Q618_9AGAR|nr:hypothetical protein BDP27DRAFT_1315003 [Rhodocollybia butyracea]